MEHFRWLFASCPIVAVRKASQYSVLAVPVPVLYMLLVTRKRGNAWLLLEESCHKNCNSCSSPTYNCYPPTLKLTFWASTLSAHARELAQKTLTYPGP